MNNETLFTVTLFDRKNRLIATIPSIKSSQVYDLAREKRPALGASYITEDGHELEFKRPRLTNPFQGPSRYLGTSTRRLSNKQIEVAACRFAKDGEYANAAALLELRK